VSSVIVTCSGVNSLHVLGMEVTSVMALSTEGRIHFLGIAARTEDWALVQAVCQSMVVVGPASSSVILGDGKKSRVTE
jgi:hypothetical protein